jgi:pyridinium-3,5-bisthiocarboxylic acid mononucleotide nickel chelatase
MPRSTRPERRFVHQIIQPREGTSMKIAYLDCASGISGDMTLGALVDAGVDLEALNAGIATLGLPDVRLAASTVKKKGFRATQITVEHEPEHKHRHLHHITAMIEGSSLGARQKELAGRIFRRLAEAEAKVHNSTIEKVHFHEVGAVDSICDIVGAAMGWDLLGVERIVCSGVPTGRGFVEIAHGRCAIPAPATAELLKGIPLVESNVECELTTPTGAAILATLVDAFGPVPGMTIDRIGYGAGQKDLEEQANLLRLLVGETVDARGDEQLWVLETNLDDASGELVGHAAGRLWEAGALDVYTTAIGMKKNRPGIMLSVLCEAIHVAAIEDTLFRETTTLGVRRHRVERRKLKREKHSVETPWGKVDGVVAWLDAHTARFSPEYESCRHLAEKNRMPLKVVYEAAQKSYDPAE